MNAKEALGNTLSQRMSDVSRGAVGVYLELGYITSSMGLSVARFPEEIPKGEYMVDITLYSDTYDTLTSTHIHSDGHTHDGGSHVHRIPLCFRKIQPGDHVLVAWVGTEPVVTMIVQSS